jgi:hypothetical protein
MDRFKFLNAPDYLDSMIEFLDDPANMDIMTKEEFETWRRSGIAKIVTSYFGNIKHLTGYTTVAISHGVPHWYHGKRLKCLAPNPNWIKLAKANPRKYIHLYKNKLNTISTEDILNELQTFGDKIALLCWEKPGAFCHRKLVAKWLNNLGLDIKEWK